MDAHLERLHRRAGARPVALLLRLAVPIALAALYAASAGSRPRVPRAPRVDVASAATTPGAAPSRPVQAPACP